VGTIETLQAVAEHLRTPGVRSGDEQTVIPSSDTQVMGTASSSIAITMESIQALQAVADRLHSGTASTRAGLVEAAATVTRVHNMLEALNLRIADAYRDLVTADLAAPDPDGRRASLAGQKLVDESRRVTGQDLSPSWHLSPASSRARVGLARTAHELLPECEEVLRRGEATEDHLTAVMKESVVLGPVDQARMDHDLASALAWMTVRQTKAAAFKRACELDAATMVERAERAAQDAHVSVRPAADCMTRLSALLPLKDGVAIDVALTRHAQRLRASGDPRCLGQLKAALLVHWVRDGATHADQASAAWVNGHTTHDSGAASVAAPKRVSGTAGPRDADPSDPQDFSDSTATPADPTDAHGSSPATAVGHHRHADGPGRHGPRVEVQITITDLALLGLTTTPAYVAGFGTIPAGLARQIIHDATTEEQATLRRLWTSPRDGTLTQMESRSRRFPRSLARFIRARDQVCTTPFCGAPIRQIDHITPHAAGGPTTAANGQGLCTACNQAKEHTRVRAGVPRPLPHETRASSEAVGSPGLEGTGRRRRSPAPGPLPPSRMNRTGRTRRTRRAHQDIRPGTLGREHPR
jgi:hypothetical protein